MRLFRALCDLQPDERVLEVGCGPGRVAWPLARYLSRQGSYVGTDVWEEALRWCQRTVGKRYNNFSFVYTDLYNPVYNPGGKQQPREYRFSFPDQSFGFIALVSVFTHLLPADMEHYMEEVRRLLNPRGRAFFTFFLLNEEQRRLTEQGRSTVAFSHISDGYASVDRVGSTVAYPEETILALLPRKGLFLREPVHYGSWVGRTRERCMSYQDILIVAPR